LFPSTPVAREGHSTRLEEEGRRGGHLKGKGKKILVWATETTGKFSVLAYSKTPQRDAGRKSKPSNHY